jgi:hypothetical protein
MNGSTTGFWIASQNLEYSNSSIKSSTVETDSYVKSTLPQRASGHLRWAFAWQDEHTEELQFVQKLFSCANPVSSTVRVAGLTPTIPQVEPDGGSGLAWLYIVYGWGQLDILPNSLKRYWKQLAVEKLTVHSLPTARVSACQMHAASTWDINGIVLCDKCTF